MSARRRIQRLNAQFQREISTLLRKEVGDPRVQGVTITRVSITPDVSIGRIFVRHLAGPEKLGEALEGLRAAGPYLRRSLGNVLHLRRIPELEFLEDHSLENAMRIESLLNEVRPEGGWQDDDDEDEGDDEAEAPDDGDADDE